MRLPANASTWLVLRLSDAPIAEYDTHTCPMWVDTWVNILVDQQGFNLQKIRMLVLYL